MLILKVEFKKAKTGNILEQTNIYNVKLNFYFIQQEEKVHDLFLFKLYISE